MSYAIISGGYVHDERTLDLAAARLAAAHASGATNVRAYMNTSLTRRRPLTGAEQIELVEAAARLAIRDRRARG